MRWLWIFLLTIFGLAPTTETISPVATPAPTTVVQAVPTITLKDQHFAYGFVVVRNSLNLSLIPNFSRPTDVQTLMTDHACTSAVSGGFYDTARKPLGFFYTNSHMYGQKIPSLLVNGFFWVDTAGTALISTDLPDSAYRFALQTGPMVLFNGQTMTLRIQNDEHARRMVVGKTKDNTLIFLTVYSPDSVFSGPLLADLPTIVQTISTKENFGVADAVNLDGGSASAFYSGETHLSELTPVGSIFCMK